MNYLGRVTAKAIYPNFTEVKIALPSDAAASLDLQQYVYVSSPNFANAPEPRIEKVVVADSPDYLKILLGWMVMLIMSTLLLVGLARWLGY